MSPTLAIIATADAASPDVIELLRMVAALVAADQPVQIVCTGAGRSALEGDDLPDDVRAYLDGVADFGIIPSNVDAQGLIDALTACRDVMRVAAVDRSSEPALLVIDNVWLETARASPDDVLATLTAAGQVIRDQGK